jgi:hypothetical protein
LIEKADKARKEFAEVERKMGDLQEEIRFILEKSCF